MKLALALFALALAGCASLGPTTVARDRFDYVEAISDSWKRQMMLNLVKVRYADAPVFLDITSVISSYEFHGQAGIDIAGTVHVGALDREHVPARLQGRGGHIGMFGIIGAESLLREDGLAVQEHLDVIVMMQGHAQRLDLDGG